MQRPGLHVDLVLGRCLLTAMRPSNVSGAQVGTWCISDLPACPLNVRFPEVKPTRYAQSEFFRV